MSFASDIQRFADRIEIDINEVRKSVAIDIFSKVITRSPVGDPDEWKSKYKPKGYIGGTFRGNWQATLGVPASGQLTSVDPSGQTAIAKAIKIASMARGDETIWMVNNLPYAYRLEYEGWSKQAPRGMVRISIAEFRRALAKQLRARK